MAGRLAGHYYDPVSLIPEGMVFNRIVLEKYWDRKNGPGYNPLTRAFFDIKDIQPEAQLRMQLRQGIVLRDEYFPGQNTPFLWSVIQDYPFEISNEAHMSDYVNSVALWITAVIRIPQDSRMVSRSLNLLRLNCQYSDKNNSLFRSVNGFQTLIEALSNHFTYDGFPTDQMTFWAMDEDTLDICREILKLAEITGFNAGDAVFITDSPSRVDGFSGILRVLLFRGAYRKDIGRILRILYVIFNIQPLRRFDQIFSTIYFISINPETINEELALCADISYTYCQDECQLMPVTALCYSLKILVARFDNSEETNPIATIRINGEYSDRSAALENVLKTLCRICAKYGAEAVNLLISPALVAVVGHLSLILKHSLLHPELGTATFGGKHLLFAMTILKYIYQRPDVYTGCPENIKILFDFAMSAVPTRFLFNGRRMLKDLADQVVENMLNRPVTEYVLRHWNQFPF